MRSCLEKGIEYCGGVKLEKILSIEEILEFNPQNKYFFNYDGYKIKTTNHEYFILVENAQHCCEIWGYLTSEDDYGSFIGKELKSFELTDCALNTKKVEESGYYGDEYGGIQFVNFNFWDGTTLQFAVYNAHNGYYGHEILVLKDSEVLFEDEF